MDNGFLFLANQPALDFLNTRPVLNGGAVELLSDFDALLRWFRAAGLLTGHEAERLQQRWGDSVRSRRVVESVLELRERLRSEVLRWEAGAPVHRSTLEELNRLMAARPMLTKLKATGEGLSRELWFESGEPEGLLAPLAHAAATLFGDVDRERVRKCGECVLHFQDTSKKGTRRWCSMQLCGNRQKVAAYAARRQKGAASRDTIQER